MAMHISPFNTSFLCSHQLSKSIPIYPIMCRMHKARIILCRLDWSQKGPLLMLYSAGIICLVVSLSVLLSLSRFGGAKRVVYTYIYRTEELDIVYVNEEFFFLMEVRTIFSSSFDVKVFYIDLFLGRLEIKSVRG